MTTPAEIAANYIALWNERDPARRAQNLSAHWTEDASYVDPLANVAGRAPIADLVGAVQRQFPSFAFAPLGVADGHGEFVRFSWGLGPVGSDAVVEGTDFVRLVDGRIAAVTGFLDKVPAQSA